MAVNRRMATGQSDRPAPPPGVVAARITTLRPVSGDGRAELIRDVVDGFRRLCDSVVRFILLFTDDDSALVQRQPGARSLSGLLSMLASEAQAARFDRMRELRRAIRDARRLEKTRDAVFSESFSHDQAAMREAAAELERVDAILVGLCVEHVLERHLTTAPSHKPQRGAER